MRQWIKTGAYALWYLLYGLWRQAPGPVILLYHSFDSRGWKFGVEPAELERQLLFLKAQYRVVPLAEVVRHARGESELAPGAVAITVDDGYQDTYDVLFPLAKKYELPFTLFLTTDLSRMDKLGNLPRPTWDELREMAHSGLVSIEAHGHTHQRFTDLIETQGALEHDLATCREAIRQHIGVRTSTVAYPHGRLSAQVVRRVQELDFTAACTTREGFVTTGEEAFRLPRVQVARETSFLQFKARLTPALTLHRRIVSLFRS